MDNEQKDDNNFTCNHCQKVKAKEHGFEKDGEMYCCDQCEARGPKEPAAAHADGTTPPNTCEFC